MAPPAFSMRRARAVLILSPFNVPLAREERDSGERNRGVSRIIPP